MDTTTPFKWRHFEPEIMLLCVRWYVRYSRELPRSGRNAAGTGPPGRAHHDLSVGPLLRPRTGPTLPSAPQSHDRCEGLVDETDVKVKGVWRSLYRAVD